MPKKEDVSDFAQHLSSNPRPRLTNHHSNSLPSTPYQSSRKLSFDAHSPSFERTSKDGSPKSIHSETESGSRSGGKAPPSGGCKYETGMAFSRRRIPYSIGGDQLERAKTPPKKFLDPPEEEKLSGDMRELYDRILPSKESDERRRKFVDKLDRILNEQWPGNDIKVHVFGSSGNMLCTSDSDVDICIATPMKALERVCLLANALAEHGMERVVCVPHAKVPIVKFWDPELQLACDMNVNNTLALENTRMIKTYVEIDERVRPLAMIVKQWTKRRILNDAALGGTLSSYTWICLILNFLQTRNPPILPCLHRKPHLRAVGTDAKTAGFNDDIERLRGFGQNNTETLGELLFNFFRRYAYDLDYEKSVVSVREAKLISKEGKNWQISVNNRLCVEEPFNTERNLGNTADDTSFRGIHLELRRAFELVKEAKLDECLEQYVFPATEEKIWEKPPPKPAPVLSRSRSQSQSTRGSRGGGYGNRGGRHNGQHHHRAATARRASSAAAMNKFATPGIGLPGLGSREYLHRDQHLHAQYEQLRLHDQLFNEYQYLQAQEHELRLMQAQAQLNAQIQAQGSSSGPITQQAARETSQRMPANNHIPLTAPLRSGQYFYPFAYPQVPGTPQQSVHTQPSSPSVKPTQPDLGRSVHRSSTTENSSANARSHSQPARPIPPNVSLQNAPVLPPNSNGFLQYQQLRQQQLYNALEIAQVRYRHAEAPMYQDPRRLHIDQRLEETVPKEYVGYWVNDSPPSYPHREDMAMPRLPTYQDLHPRARGIPQNLSRLRNTSRSPSPSPVMPFRDRSFSIRSASSAPPGPSRFDRVQGSTQGPRTSGPLIVSGTDGWHMPDYSAIGEASSHTTTISETTSGSDDRLYETPGSAELVETPGQLQGLDDGFALDDPQHYFHTLSTPEPSRVPMNNRNGNLESTVRRVNPQASEAPNVTGAARRSENWNRPSGGLGIQFGEHDMFRPSAKAGGIVPEQNSVSATKKPEPKADQVNTRIENPLIPMPILSPVREVRTPSPSAKRIVTVEQEATRSGRRVGVKMDLYIPPFAEIVRARQEKQNGTFRQKTNGLPYSNHAESPASNQAPQAPKTNHVSEGAKPGQLPNGPKMNHVPESPKAIAHQTQMNGWQHPSKKGKKTKPRPHSGQVLPGEPFPANETERKGG